MNKYYKICVFYFDKYDIYGEDKLYMEGTSEVIIAKKVKNGYKEIVTSKFIQEKNIIDVNRNKLYDTQIGIYYTKKGIIKEILEKGYIIGTDTEYERPTEVKDLNEIKDYLNFYIVNKFPKMLKKIQSIKYHQQKSKILTNNLVTEENVKKLVKEYKYGKEE